MYKESFHPDRFAACKLIVRPTSRSASLHNFFIRVTAFSIQNTNMKQYVISLALLIAAPVAFPTSHANAQSQAEMNRQAAKDFEKVDAELNKTYEALLNKLPDV